MWRFLSESVDDVILSLSTVFDGRILRASGDGPPPDFEALVAEQEARPPEVRWPERFERRVGRLKVSLPAIDSETFADFHPAARADADTLVVYHHGLSEFPHDASAAPILTRPGLRERCDWVAIRGAHHETRAAVLARLLHSHESFGRGLLSSVFAVRALAERFRPRYRHVVVCGMSLGGLVALTESAVGSVFDLVIPLLSGPDVESVLLRSSFTTVVCPRYLARCQAGGLGNALDLAPRLAGRDGPPIRAILARYDRLFHLAPQRAAYARIPRATVAEISGGHITGAMRFATLAAHVERALEVELWRGAGAPAAPAVAAA